jgi:GntR family transcriptional regulator, L-lactate dehydrogenase operon regulator
MAATDTSTDAIRPAGGNAGDNARMRPSRLSDRIAAQLRALIADHALQPGDRLPPERALALQLGVSRTALREAIAQLSSQGVLRARVGGGTYVQGPQAAAQVLSEPLVPYLPLFQGDPEYRFDVLEIRHALEGATAWHAALRADDDDRTRIREAFQVMLDAHGHDDPAGEARADAAFHLSIAEASHNLVLLQVMRGLFELLQTNISQSRQKLYGSPRTFDPLSAQHREMMDAVLAGDPERARAAAQTHLEFVHTSLRTLDEDDARRARASRLPSTQS